MQIHALVTTPNSIFELDDDTQPALRSFPDVYRHFRSGALALRDLHEFPAIVRSPKTVTFLAPTDALPRRREREREREKRTSAREREVENN